jgi:ligand-binding sensor domain-containing protein/AraC-like DNA-binding protein
MAKQVNPGLFGQLLAVIVIAHLFCYPGWALDPDKPVDQYLIDQWGMLDGLPSDTVLSIAQTADGYLWIGTSRGLVRFDGLKFVSLPVAEKEEIHSREIRNLCVDRQGDLWVGSAGGLTVYRSQKGRFKLFTRSHGITGGGIRHLKEDMRGNLWISFTSSFVNRFTDGEFTAFNASHGLLGKKVNAIVEDGKGNLLFGSRENGIFTYREGKFFQYPVPGLDNILIITMIEDRSGALWIGTNNGLFRVNGAAGKEVRRFTVRDGLSDDYISSISEDSEKNLWVGTIKGLNRLAKKQDGTVGFESLLHPFIINYLFEGREKSLWIGTNDSGLKRLKDGTFTACAPLAAHPEEIALCLFEDRQGDTWIGTVGGKLFRCRGRHLIDSVEIPELKGTGVTAIADDAAGNLWLGTTGKGVFQKQNNRFVRFTSRQGLADNLVTSIFRDSRGNLWFSTFDGVSVLRNRDGIIESFKSRHGLRGKVVHNVYEDKARNIWIAADRGVTILKDGKVVKQNIDHYLPDISVTCMYEDPSAPAAEGRVYWLATDGAGLKRLNIRDGPDVNLTSYTTAQGMPSNFIYQFLEDSQGNFWLMSDSGILRVGKGELDRLAGGGVDKINCTSFGTADGLKSLEFYNMFSKNSVLKTGNGEFWFITRKGISIVNPAKIRLNKTPPPVVLEAVFFNGAKITTYKGIKDVSFHFTAPTFLSPEKTRFKYRLEGVDREWIFLSPGQERVAHYKDLPAGTYTFRVTAGSAEGVWNQTGDSVTFSLKSYYYQTLLFKIAVLLLLTALLTVVLYIYKRRPFEKMAKYKGSPLHPDFAQACITRLNYLMEVEKVYCDADLSLQSLAEKMSISPHLLSQILNEKLNRNFADFINSCRIEEAKKILHSPRGARRKITAVAGEVGFNTMVAFYRAFKKYTQMTPTQYKKEARNKK